VAWNDGKLLVNGQRAPSEVRNFLFALLSVYLVLMEITDWLMSEYSQLGFTFSVDGFFLQEGSLRIVRILSINSISEVNENRYVKR